MLWVQGKSAKASIEVFFRSSRCRPAGDKVQILIEDDDGRTSELEAVHWPGLGWTDAVTLLRIENEVLGWRRRPFERGPPSVDYTGWTREQFATEMKRRFGGDDGAETDDG